MNNLLEKKEKKKEKKKGTGQWKKTERKGKET